MAKRRRKQTKKKFLSGDVVVVILIIASILLGILIYAETGTIGKTLSPVLGGIMGFMKYLLPVATLLLAIYIACNNKEYIVSKMIQWLVILIAISVIMTVYQISTGHITTNLSFREVIGQGYDLGTRDVGGGAFGTAITFPLVKLIGAFPTAILAVGTLIVLGVFIFGMRPSQVLSDAVDKLEEKKLENKEEREKERELRKKRKEERKAQKQEQEKESSVEEVLEDQITFHLGKSKKDQQVYHHDLYYNVAVCKHNHLYLPNLT